MDPSSLSLESRELHREMTAELRRALTSATPMKDAQALCSKWESVHAQRDQDRKRIESQIRQAKAHYRFEEAERLEQQLASL